MNLDKAKDLIKDLLNVANDDAAAKGEIENAMRFARRLMLRHNIREEDVSVSEPKTAHEIAADEEYGSTTTMTHGANLSKWEGSLMGVLADLVGTVKNYYNPGAQLKRSDHGTIQYDDNGKPIKGTRVTFYGPAEDAKDAADLFVEWTTVIASMARLRFGGVFRGPGRSYCEGFVVGMREAFMKITQEEQKEIEGGFAIVLVGARELMQAKRKEATNWLETEKNIKVTASRRSNYGKHHSGAYGAGREDGLRANMTRKVKPKLT